MMVVVPLASGMIDVGSLEAALVRSRLAQLDKIVILGLRDIERLQDIHTLPTSSPDNKLI